MLGTMLKTSGSLSFSKASCGHFKRQVAGTKARRACSASSLAHWAIPRSSSGCCPRTWRGANPTNYHQNNEKTLYYNICMTATTSRTENCTASV